MAPSSPTSPAFPTPSPRSPHSPMAVDHPMISPLPQLVTTFASEYTLHRQAIFSAKATTPTTTTAPWSRSNGTSCRRNSHASPMNSPAQAAFTPMSPGFPAYMIRTPERGYFSSAHAPIVTSRPQDGRQSRMAMRSPGYDRVMTLPLRVNTNLAKETIEEEEHASEMASSASSSSSSLIEWASSPNNRRLVRSHAPAPIHTRSPIRKRAKLSRFPQASRLPTPPRYHVTVLPTFSPTTRRNKQQYLHSVEHLRAPLVPLISVSNGLSHPHFPTSLLQYHLLTHGQLDSLARWYHQVTPPVEETFQYPAWIPAWTSIHPSHAAAVNGEAAVDVDLETKRRRWGRFIGLRGCDTPTVEMEDGVPVQSEEATRERPDELARRMEREWRRALERAEEESQAWEKSWRGRW